MPVVDQLVLRKVRVEEQEHEHSRIIACTAHDLLTRIDGNQYESKFAPRI